MENVSLADIAAVTDRDDCRGGSWIWIILVVLLLGNNWNRNDFGQYATAASQQEILFGQQFQNLGSMVNKVAFGQCDSTYALNNSITGVGRQVDANKYEAALGFASVNANIDNKFAALEKSQLEQRIAEQAGQIQQLRLEQQMCGVVRYPMSYAYNAGPSPFCNCGGYGYNYGTQF